MKKRIISLSVLLIIIVFNLKFSAPVMPETIITDPLPSWNEGTNKQTIINFVESVTNLQSFNYISPKYRIATFDNDGTLWAEKPTYFQAAFTISRLIQLAPQHPEWQNQQPFQAVLENDQQYLANLSVSELLEMVMVTHAQMNQQAFENEANQFFQTAKHPRFQRRYSEIIYQPMLELLAYLQANGFTNYICSAGGLDFMRLVSEEIYGIPIENVIGSSIVKEFQVTPQGFEFFRQAKLVEPINDRGGKPFNIDRFIGKKPVIAVGNSDGDIEMMQYAVMGKTPSLALLLHHDDEEREYSYRKGTEKALELAPEYNWQVISFKEDFKYIYPFELKKS